MSRKKYTPQDLAILLEGVNSGTPISVLEQKLGRTSRGLELKLGNLLSQDEDAWDREKINLLFRDIHSRRWLASREDAALVERSRQQIDDYLLEHPDAATRDLQEAGLLYALFVSYGGLINEARNQLGLAELGPRELLKPTNEQRRQGLISYLRINRDASSEDLRRDGYSRDILAIEDTLESLRREAGIVPEGYIRAAEASRKLGKSREGISFLFRTGKLEGIRVGRDMYISQTSIRDYSQTNSEPTLK